MTDDSFVVLILKPLRDPEGVSVAIRLRALLKTALRRDRLRCTAHMAMPQGTPTIAVDELSPAETARETP